MNLGPPCYGLENVPAFILPTTLQAELSLHYHCAGMNLIHLQAMIGHSILEGTKKYL